MRRFLFAADSAFDVYLQDPNKFISDSDIGKKYFNLAELTSSSLLLLLLLLLLLYKERKEPRPL